MGDVEYSADSSKHLARVSKMIVYTSRGCVRCAMLKKWLKSRDIEFMEKNLDDVDVMADLIMRNAVVLSAPALEVEEALFTEDQIFDENGSIKDMLQENLEGKINGL